MADQSKEKKSDKTKTTQTKQGTRKAASANAESGTKRNISSKSAITSGEAVIGAVKKMTPQQRKPLIILLIAVIIIFGIYMLAGDPLGFFEEPVDALPVSSDTVPADPSPASPAKESADQKTGEPGGAIAVDGTLEVYVLDVGQGDSIFLKSPSGRTMLIDTSTSSAWDSVDGFLRDEGITKLDVVIATHPHEDHIGSMQKLIRGYDIGVFYMPDATANTRTFEKMIDALDECDVKVIKAEAGQLIEWDEQVEARILSPVAGKEYKNVNNYSVVCRVKFGDTAIMLTGDAEHEAEADALNESPSSYFNSAVLKAGHHGSSTASGEEFFDTVNPSVFAISCGSDNTYGHPHRETMELLERKAVPWYRTDEQGIIHITLDGKSVAVKTEK